MIRTTITFVQYKEVQGDGAPWHCDVQCHTSTEFVGATWVTKYVDNRKVLQEAFDHIKTHGLI